MARSTSALTWTVALSFLLSVVGVAALSREARAQTTCVRATNKVVRGKVVTSLSRATRSGKCRTGEVPALSGPTGVTGATGATGADGQLRIYGDGSSGAKTVAADETFSDAVAMYTDVVIDSGRVLTVLSGTVIRCTGSFTNNGLIRVLTGSASGRSNGLDSSSVAPAQAGPQIGISAAPAMTGEIGNSGAVRSGGSGGTGLPIFQAKLLRYPGPFGGGGGAGSAEGIGGKGGGSLVVLCSGPITNNGQIRADGEESLPFGGGGGGGVIILASRTSVTSISSSSVFARGGPGGDSSLQTGAGGGGGGGIIHFMAPILDTAEANTSAAGGSGGVSAGDPFLSTIRMAGPGGGGSGGDGGAGGSIAVSGTSSAIGTDGSSGHIINTTVDPTSLF